MRQMTEDDITGEVLRVSGGLEGVSAAPPKKK